MTTVSERARELLASKLRPHVFGVPLDDLEIIPKRVALAAIEAALSSPIGEGVREGVIEECARVAEAKYAGHGEELNTVRSHNYEYAGKQIAKAIRSLASTPTDRGEAK